VRKLQQAAARLRSQAALQQDYSRWAEGEMRAAHERLQLGLAGHVEQWRARQWARRLEQLKAANDSLGSSLQVGRGGAGPLVWLCTWPPLGLTRGPARPARCHPRHSCMRASSQPASQPGGQPA
jgi:hypothetical protein